VVSAKAPRPDWSSTKAAILTAEYPGMGGLNDLLAGLAQDTPTYDEVEGLVDLWLNRNDLPSSQMAWLLGNCFGSNWRARVVALVEASASTGHDDVAAWMLQFLADAGRAEGTAPPLLGSGGSVDIAPPPVMVDHQFRPIEVRHTAAAEPDPEAKPDPDPDSERPATDNRRFRAARNESLRRAVDLEYSDRRTAFDLAVDGGAMLGADQIGDGLPSTWVVSSDQPLSTADLDVSTYVHLDTDGEPVRWFAEFTLFIPAVDNSETRQVHCDGAGDQVLDIRVYAQGAHAPLLRHMTVRLPADDAQDATELANEAVAEPADSINPPHHEFTTPPASLELTVYDDDTGLPSVRFHAEHEPQPNVEIWPESTELARRVTAVRQRADAFRRAHSAYFEAISADELGRRLDRQLANYYLGQTANWGYDASVVATGEADATDAATTDDGQITVAIDDADTWDRVAASNEALELANAGYLLYQTCFPDGTLLRGIVDNLPPGSLINVDWALRAGNASMPWHLMYTQDPTLAPFIEGENFLGLRFRVSWSKWRRAPASTELGPFDTTERLHVLYWNDAAGDAIHDEAEHQRRVVGALQNHRVVPLTADTAAKIDQAKAEFTTPTSASILHFYCHCVHPPGGGDSKLVFGPTASANPADFEIAGMSFGNARFSGEPFVFVNACDSASADVYEVNEIEQMFFRRGARAFMGTEVKVPVGLAARYAHVFFRLLEEPLDDAGLFTGEAAALARRYLWLNYRNIGGLFYSYIHHYGLRMTPG